MHFPHESTPRTDDWIGARLRAEAPAARREPSPELRGRIHAAIDRARLDAALRTQRRPKAVRWLAAASLAAALVLAASLRPRLEPAPTRLALATPPIDARAIQAAMFETIFGPSAIVSSAADTALRGELLALALDSSRLADAVMDGFARPMRHLTPRR